MHKFKLIVNPVAGRGAAGRAIPGLHKNMAAHGLDYDLICTENPSDLESMAKQALADGFETIVAVGGDGTAHGVVNGMLDFSDGEPVGTMTAFPLGSGSDFANMLGMPANLNAACARLAEGQTRWQDVGVVTDSQGKTTYVDNTVGIGFDGVVTSVAMGVKYLTGMALYLPVVLKTVFVEMKPPRVVIEYDDTRLEQTSLMIVACIGQREGGGFIIAPDASVDDGLFDVCVARNIPKLQILGLIPHFMKGTHVDKEPVTMFRTDKLTVTSVDDLIAHVDGEMLCTEERRLEFHILPRHLKVLY